MPENSRIQNVHLPHQTFEEGTVPATPDAGTQRIYVDSADHTLKIVNENDVVTPIGSSPTAIHTDVAGEFDILTEKETPAAGDKLLIEDAAASGAKKWVDVDNLPGGTGGGGALELIAEVTPSGVSTIIVANNIVSTYKKLVIEYAVRTTEVANFSWLHLIFNNDTTSTNYRYMLLWGYGGSTQGAEGADGNRINTVSANSSPANSCGSGHIEIPFYASTSWNKRATCQGSQRFDNTSIYEIYRTSAMEWESNVAITRVDMSVGGGNFAAGSVIRLYGVDNQSPATGPETVLSQALNVNEFFLPTLMPDSNTNFSTITDASFGQFYLQSSGAQNDLATWNANMPAGVYTFKMFHFRGSNRGKYHLLVNNVDVGTIDGYVAVGDSIFSTITGIQITGGPTTITLKMSDKNASSTSYFGAPVQIALVCTSMAVPPTATVLNSRKLIATATPSGTGTVTFAGISSNYKDLMIEYMARSTKSGVTYEDMNIELNGDTTAANYRSTRLHVFGTSSSAVDAFDSNVLETIATADCPANVAGIGVIEIKNYRGPFNKQVQSHGSYRRDTSSNQVIHSIVSVEWENNAAISQIVLKLATGNFVAGSEFRLYGIYEQDGAALQINPAPNYLGIKTFTPPPSIGWSWDNQASSTINSSSGYEYMNAPAQSGVKASIRYRTPVSTRYSVEVAFLMDIVGFLSGTGGANNGGVLCGFRDSTGKMVLMQHQLEGGNFKLSSQKWTNSVTFSAAYKNFGPLAQLEEGFARPLFVRFDYDGTNLAVYKSLDGNNWVQYDTRLKSDFLTGDPVPCWGAYANDCPIHIALLHWKEIGLS